MIKFNCTKCQAQFKVDDKYAGKKTRCKKCNNICVIPSIDNTAAKKANAKDYDRLSLEFVDNFDVFDELLQYENQAPPIDETVQ